MKIKNFIINSNESFRIVKNCYLQTNFKQFNSGSPHPSADFTHHTIVKPVLYHKQLDKRIHSTKGSNGFHVKHLFIKLTADKQIFELDLTLNSHLLADGFFHRYQENGSDKIFRHNKKDSDLCEYKGKVRGKTDSWVALSTCDGLNGVIFDGKELHYVSSQKNLSVAPANSSNIDHFFYSHSNIRPHNKSCGECNADHQILRYKRHAAQTKSVHVPYTADKLSKYVELLLVFDNREYNAFGRSRRLVVQRGKSIINLVNAFYSPLNIFVVLVGIVIWSERDEISLSNGADTLSNFANYRKNILLKDHPNDNAQLLGKFHLGSSNVGKGYTGTICSLKASVAVNEDHSDVVGIVAGTIAHELGHNFGMLHDNKDCKCPEKSCIMASVSSTATTWSSCSLYYLMLSFTQGLDYCLRNEPKKLLDYPVCGNGFVERGEECDCGLPEYCNNICCNASSCMLKSNASCASGACCDLTTCKLKDAGTLCRSADYECDLPEYCTGQTEYCPENTHKMDTEPCANGNAYCHQGYCRTRNDQCELLWGLSGESCEEKAYEQNLQANEYGNCGYNEFSNLFKKCQNEDKFCGMLQCRTLNEKPQFGLWDNVHSYFSFSNQSFILCRSLSSTFDHNVINPTMVPNGAPCGYGKMCLNQKCVSVSSLRKGGRDCSNNCNNGWCNNLGHCHCKDGFAPPNCDSTGPGGSEDSGPATFANQGEFDLMCLLIVIVVLILAACAIFWCYLRREEIHKTLRISYPSVYLLLKNVGDFFTTALQTCSCFKCLNRLSSGNSKRNNLSHQDQHVTQIESEIVIESVVSSSTTNLEVAECLNIVVARENLKKIGNFRKQETSRIATQSYPKNEGNVIFLARTFENSNFKEEFI